MTLEVLFAQASQCRTFLLMVLCGAAVGLLVQLAGLLHQLNRWLGMAADLLCAAGLALAVGWILTSSGEGLRLYGLLGLCIGGTLYAAGLGAPISRILHRLKPRPPAGKNSPPSAAGNSPTLAE